VVATLKQDNLPWQQHLQTLRQAQLSPLRHAGRRGLRARRCRGQIQAAVKRQAALFYRWSQQQGESLPQAAKRLGLTPRTLGRWARPGSDEMLVLRGRPLVRSDRLRRSQVLELLAMAGARLGVPALRQYFPDMPRAELADLRDRYRRVLRRRHHALGYVLHWQRPGRVWAIDFAEFDTEDDFKLSDAGCIVAVRDLASGYQLAWRSAPQATAQVTMAVLTSLFARHGAPLVLKSDNGSAFRAHETKAFLEEAGVAVLYSPPSWPAYNGAIEAGIGSLKRRTEHHAQSAGRWDWTDDDLAAARAQANHTPRWRGRSPAELWQARTPITALARACFDLMLQRHRFAARHQESIAFDMDLDHWQESRIDRKAISRALVEHGDLMFTRRPIPLTIRRQKMANIR
jgi:transposase InsO family protein